MTEESLQELDEQAKKAGDSQKKLADRGLSLLDSFDQMVGSALAGANSMNEFTDALIRGGGQLLGQTAQSMFGGFPGGIIGGAIQFGINRFLNGEDPLPVNNGALDVRLVDVNDNVIDLVAVRDRAQKSYDYQRRQNMEMSLRRGA